MSGGRQTGTVPKTKHNSRVRRENQVNHIPNNLDWPEPYTPQRVRKESNTNTRHSDTGDDGFYEENPWVGLAQSNRTDDDELRWSNVKTSNITPERGNSSTNVDGYVSSRSLQRQENNGTEEREMPGTSKDTSSRGRLKMKMEQSQRKIEELQQTQAALMSLRSKAIQQVKPVQMEEMQQHSGMLGLRNKAIQQVKPVQVEMDHISNMEARLQAMQNYSSIMHALERDETTANLVEPSDMQCDHQLRIKLNELLVKKAQCDNILACIDTENIPGGAASVSSDDGEASQAVSRARAGFHDGDEASGRRDVNKQDNRELENHSLPSQLKLAEASIHNKELKLEEVRNKLEQLQTLLNRVESLREVKSSPRMNGEASHMEPGCKNCPPHRLLVDKLATKKMDLDQDMRKFKPLPVLQGTQYFNGPPPVESWPSSMNGATANSVDFSSDEGEVEYDESPVKLCSTGYIQPNSFSKGSLNGHPSGMKIPTAPPREGRRAVSREPMRPPRVESEVREIVPNVPTLAEQITRLQMQMDQMQLLYQGMFEKQQASNFSTPQPWLPQPNLPNLGFMQFMNPPAPQWHQHQLLINSLNQCCQLIWHQQRELAGLRQALAMIQDESHMYKCGGYGNNLNFDPSGMLWAQTSPQTLNNQVPPGNRANNYWDNFRSYSRQNLLSGRNKSNEGSISDSLPTRPQIATDNLRRKENHGMENSQTNTSQLPSGDVSDMGSSRSRRRYNSNLKADATAVFSLEQSIYSELEAVIAQSERSPQVLLQLLTQLKSMRPQGPSPFDDGNPLNFETECEPLEARLPSFPNITPRVDDARSAFIESRRKFDVVLGEVSRILKRQQCEMCTSDVISEVVACVSQALNLDGKFEAELHGALITFRGSQIRKVADKIIYTIIRVEQSFGNKTSNGPVHPSLNNDNEDLIDQAEEEGAVGGISLMSQSKPQSVEADLAEADQIPCNSADNIEMFEVEAVLPDVELDNQELPPREENQEQPLQDP